MLLHNGNCGIIILYTQRHLIKDPRECLVIFVAQSAIVHGAVVIHGQTWDKSVKNVTS